MRNITAAVSNDPHRKARIWRPKSDLSISAILGEALHHLPHPAPPQTKPRFETKDET
jgi:hypothetical protein